MTRFRLGLSIVAVALLSSLASHATAAVIFVTDNLGNVWQYDNMADMAGQTTSTITGTKVRDATVQGNAYASDQDTTMDLGTGRIYRITGSGDIIRYNHITAYLTNVNGVVEGTLIYGGTKKVNGLSYDGGTSGFYAVPASGSTFNSGAVGGDIIQFGTGSGGPVARFLAANNNGGQNLTTANYTGAVLNFYDPDPTAGTTVGNPPTLPQKSINARYYQVASNGRLEGFESLVDYNASSNNRINISALNAFGGTSSFQAVAAFAVPPQLAAIPEASSALIWLGIVLGTGMIRRR